MWRLTLQVLHLLFLLCQVGRMGEQPAGGPGPAISPGQQMMASSTGAILTSVFGEITTSVLRVSVSLRRLKARHCVHSHAAGRCEDQAAGSANAAPPRSDRSSVVLPLLLHAARLHASLPPLPLALSSHSLRPALCFIALIQDSAPRDGVTRPSKCEYLTCSERSRRSNMWAPLTNSISSADTCACFLWSWSCLLGLQSSSHSVTVVWLYSHVSKTFVLELFLFMLL